jgi:RNA polymerase sigma-70 factor (ECF subfamily)
MYGRGRRASTVLRQPGKGERFCYLRVSAWTIDVVGREESTRASNSRRDRLYETAIVEFGRAIDRLAAGYEADPEKRQDLRQEIHFRLWKSFEVFDRRCSLKTWIFRVAHNTAASYAGRERRSNAVLVGLEEVERIAWRGDAEPDIDQQRALQQLSQLLLKLKPLDRQIMICYLEEMEMAHIAEITGISPANVAMKVHRIKSILSRRFGKGST